jgi:hypothetical protein
MSAAPVRVLPMLAPTVSVRGRAVSGDGGTRGAGSSASRPAHVCDVWVPDGVCACIEVASPATPASTQHIADHRNPPDLDIRRTSPRKNESDAVQHPCPMRLSSAADRRQSSGRGFCICSVRPVRSSDSFACRVRLTAAISEEFFYAHRNAAACLLLRACYLSVSTVDRRRAGATADAAANKRLRSAVAVSAKRFDSRIQPKSARR